MEESIVCRDKESMGTRLYTYSEHSLDVWIATFSAGRLACPVGVISIKEVDKAKLLRLIRKLKRLH
jgi:hypothetical protein